MINKPNKSQCTATLEYIDKYHKWDFRKLLDKQRQFPSLNHFILYGGRNSGKSTNCGKILLDDAYKGNKFVYIVRDNLKTGKVSGYFSKWDNRVKNTSKEFYIEYENENGYLDSKCIGYIIPLTLEEDFKSGFDFSDVKNIIFEEFTCINVARYIDEEITHYMSLLSTIERDRKGEINCYYIGNNNTRLCDYCPMFTALGIDFPTLELKQGEYKILRNGKVYIEYVAQGINPDNDKSILSVFDYACNEGNYSEDIEILDIKENLANDVVIMTSNGVNISFASDTNYIIVHTTDAEADYNVLNPRNWLELSTYITNLQKICSEKHIPTLYADAKSKYEFQFLLRDIDNFGKPQKAR